MYIILCDILYNIIAHINNNKIEILNYNVVTYISILSVVFIYLHSRLRNFYCSTIFHVMNLCYIIFGDLITDIDIHQSISHFNLRYSLYCVIWYSIIKNFNYSTSFMNMVCYGTIHSILEIFIPKVMPVLPYISTCVTGHILSIICIFFINQSKECIEKNDKIIDFLSLRVIYIGITYILFIPF